MLGQVSPVPGFAVFKSLTETLKEHSSHSWVNLIPIPFVGTAETLFNGTVNHCGEVRIFTVHNAQAWTPKFFNNETGSTEREVVVLVKGAVCRQRTREQDIRV